MPGKSFAGGAILLHPILVPEEFLSELASRQDEVLDLREVAAFLKASEEDVLRMVREQALPARQVGEGWRFLKVAIREWLRSGTPAQLSREKLADGLRAVLGKWPGDETEEQIREALEELG